MTQTADHGPLSGLSSTGNDSAQAGEVHAGRLVLPTAVISDDDLEAAYEYGNLSTTVHDLGVILGDPHHFRRGM